MSHDLAIIIPAYKPDYFQQTLESVLSQSDQRFSLYIFDDASPHNLSDIVHSFNLPDNVHYHRFDQNAGQDSLVKHWRRCIEHIRGEQWIWLFSDDDLMDEDCVKEFYKARSEYTETECFRFDTEKIDAEGNLIRENHFPDKMTAPDFLNLKLSSKQESYVVEYIFSAKVYQQLGGFPDLPLAWASDDLFWTKIADKQPVRSIKGPVVKWRYSSVNISGGKNKTNAVPKLKASGVLVSWINQNPKIKNDLIPGDLHIYWFARQIRTLQNDLSLMEEIVAVMKICMVDLRILKHYFNVKKEKSRVIGWLMYTFKGKNKT